MLVYKALGFQTPTFAHMSLILAPDKSKLSKRHGATSVGEFREQVCVVWLFVCLLCWLLCCGCWLLVVAGKVEG